MQKRVREIFRQNKEGGTRRLERLVYGDSVSRSNLRKMSESGTQCNTITRIVITIVNILGVGKAVGLFRFRCSPTIS